MDNNEYALYQSCPISGDVYIICQHPIPNERSIIPLNIVAHEVASLDIDEILENQLQVVETSHQ